MSRIVQLPCSVLGRRSGNFKPTMWDYNFMQTLKGEHTEKNNMEEVERMKETVKSVMNAEMKDPLRKLELIDAAQRLGLEYQFKAEIMHALGRIHSQLLKDSMHVVHDDHIDDDLYATALLFRLLRHHGYSVPQDVFKRFMDSETCRFKESLGEDVKGVLSLYEASFLRFKDEAVLDEAMSFSISCLKSVDLEAVSPNLARKIDHALYMPIHLRPCRVEARWFMDEYKEEPEMNSTLLKLAILDYNILQSIHKKEAAELVRWWLDLGLNKLTFFRDRVMEGYLWHNLMVFEPQYEASRTLATRMSIFILLMDDIYDVYGSFDELELLTDLIDRWTIDGIEKLPPTIGTCYLALYNSTNEFGDWVEKRRGINVIPYLHKVWTDLCKGFLVEAKWYHNGLQPTFKEYINNGVSTSGVCTMLMSYLVTTSDNLTTDMLDYIANVPSITHCCAIIMRLNNDLATSQWELARGDSVKAVECYMNETGATEAVARDYIKSLVDETWKILNKDRLNECPFDGAFVRACVNLARNTHLFYQYGDGVGIPDRETKKHIVSVLLEPVPME